MGFKSFYGIGGTRRGKSTSGSSEGREAYLIEANEHDRQSYYHCISTWKISMLVVVKHREYLLILHGDVSNPTYLLLVLQ